MNGLYGRRQTLDTGMATFFELSGVSRQGFHAARRPTAREASRTPPDEVLSLAGEVGRTFLPGASSRLIYGFIRSRPDLCGRLKGWGRDVFEEICLEKGFRVESRRFVPKTTQRGAYMFPNLVEGLSVRGTDRVWVSDISYLYGWDGRLVGYSTSLIDVYSRVLLGLSFSQTMHAAVTSQEVLRQAFQYRGRTDFPGLIFHSDGGKQYIAGEFLDMLRDGHVRSSMAENCYANAHAESFNDILKNHILPGLPFNSFVQLKKNQPVVMRSYNEFRPHGGLGKMTPLQFEKHLLTLPEEQWPELRLTTQKTGQ